LDGKAIGKCLPRHRNKEFVESLDHIDQQVPKDLDVHLIMDNYATHKHANVKAWLDEHPRYHVHFTPTSSSWLNLVELFLPRSRTVEFDAAASAAYENSLARSTDISPILIATRKPSS